MTTNFENASLDLAVTNPSGTFDSSSDSQLARFGVVTNNYTGYILSISSNSNNSTELINKDTGAKLTSIDTALTPSSFDNPIYNGKWGYLPSKYNSEANIIFRPAPTSSASTLDETVVANTKKPATTADEVNCINYECNEYTIGLGARVDYTANAGAYSNTFTLLVVGKPSTYTINYDDTSSDTSISNMPDSSTGSIDGTKVALSTVIPSRTNYIFDGWCDTATINEPNGSTSCPTSATVYPASTTEVPSYYNIDQTTSNTATLYAIWTINSYDITIKTVEGISKVILNGQECTSTSGCVIPNLISGQSYSLVAQLDSHYNFSGWALNPETDSGTIVNPSETGVSTDYIVGNQEATITPSATKKSYNITFKTNNASSIVLNGTTYTNNQMASIPYGTYTIYGNYSSRYGFSSWSASAGVLDNTNTQVSLYTVNNNATLSLTGEYVSVAIQNLSSTNCTSNPLRVYDNRDGQVYTIKRLLDGNCWMVDNLNLGVTNLSTDLTSSNTNLSSTITSSTFNNWKKTIGTTSSTNGAFVPVAGGDAVSRNKYATLYNFCAASAGTICTSSNTVDAVYDLCPAGWKLPTGGNFMNNFKYLKESYNSSPTNMHDSIYNGGAAVTLSGWWVNYATTPNEQNYSGRYWSSVRYNNTSSSQMFILHIVPSGNILDPDDYGSRSIGASIRCVLKDAGEESMQRIGQMSSSDKTNFLTKMSADKRYIALDKRDNNTYTIAKINGRIWMTQNLRLQAGSIIHNTDSNIADSSYTIPNKSLTSGNSYTEARITCTSNTSTGCYYNQCAASAGTVCSSSSVSTQTYDICPKGWRIPTNADVSPILGSDYTSQFLPTLVGHYYSGYIDQNGSTGSWPTSTQGSTQNAANYILYSNGVRLYIQELNRVDGNSLRCILSN